jgi:glycosyltransferase involved in cell wall biosynthesis
MRPVSIVTVTNGGLFFVRLLVDQVRARTADRPYEIVAVDRGSRDGTREWLARQPDVRLIGRRQRRRGHGHGESAERGVRAARHDAIVLLDSDSHPTSDRWLSDSVDRLDANTRLAGTEVRPDHRDNPHGWYVHPSFMAFWRSDLGGLVVLRKRRGADLDTGEQSTLRMVAAGSRVVRHPLRRAFDVGHPHYPTVSGGVFHAWYGTRLALEPQVVARETKGRVTVDSYLRPVQDMLRAAYGLTY